MRHLSEEKIKAFVMNTLMHVREERKRIIKKVNLSTSYQLCYNLFLLSEKEKAAIFDKLTRE